LNHPHRVAANSKESRRDALPARAAAFIFPSAHAALSFRVPARQLKKPSRTFGAAWLGSHLLTVKSGVVAQG
jgi:hypothetical protein